jgi:hypothetical protein
MDAFAVIPEGHERRHLKLAPRSAREWLRWPPLRRRPGDSEAGRLLSMLCMLGISTLLCGEACASKLPMS